MGIEVTAFFEERIIARGSRDEVTRAVEQGWPTDHGAVRAYDDATGRPVDLDLWDAGVRPAASEEPPRRRGRPSLGVTAREVTLLPRHWEWLAGQPGGASAAIRRLVDAARRDGGTPDRRARHDAAYHFLTDMAGDRPGYEEAIRALYRDDAARFGEIIASWPADVAAYARALLEFRED